MHNLLDFDYKNTSDSLSFSMETFTSLNKGDIIRSINESLPSGYILSDADKQRIIIIAALMAFTIIGNMTLILALLCKRSRRKKRVNILLLNLAFGDLAVAMFVNTTEILFLAFGDWALGPVVCKISVYVQMICLSSATNLLTAMSIDRYQVIVKPMQSLARKSWIWLKISVAWALSLLFPIPQLFIFVQYNSGLKYDGTPRRICGSRGYTAPWQRKLYFSYTTVYTLIVPVVIMLYCYVNIIHVVWIRAKYETRCLSCVTPSSTLKTASASSTPARFYSSCEKDTDTKTDDAIKTDCSCGYVTKVKEEAKYMKTINWVRNLKRNKHSSDNTFSDIKTDRKKDLDEEGSNPGSPRMSVRRGLVSSSKRRVLIMTLTVVISFLVCHTPYFCITLVRIYSDYKVKLEMAMIISEFMVMIHSTLNPVLYGLFTLRDYHIKYALAFLTLSRCSESRHGRQSATYSDEKHHLLTSVRSRLVSFSSNDRTTTTIVSNGYISNIPVTSSGRNTREENVPLSQHVSSTLSSESLTPSSNLMLARSKTMPQFVTTIKNTQHYNSDTILFASTEVLHSSNRDEILSKHKD